jgi:hypothetical protein
MAFGPKPSSARAHSARLAYCGLAHALTRPAQVGTTACSCGPPASEAGPSGAPRRSGANAGARAARVTAGGARAALHRGATGDEWLRHEPWQGLHREHPRHTANPPDMARRTNSQLGGRATRKQRLTGTVDGARAQQR